MAPLVSIVIPTRDRPQFVERVLRSLVLQECRDFEVVIADNPLHKPARPLVEHFGQLDIRCITPESPLLMHDNWELGCAAARGRYVCVLSDKVVLVPGALERVRRLVDEHDVDIVSWWSAIFGMSDPEGVDPSGVLSVGAPRLSPVPFDPMDELRWRFSLETRRADQGMRFGRGKICYGVYHRQLLQRIRDRIGRVFHPISPDYTSMIAALGCAETALDLRESLQVTAVAAEVSTGNVAEQDERAALRFIRAIDPSMSVLDSFPIPRLYASSHNSVASDYCRVRDELGGQMSELALDWTNLVTRVAEDLELHETWHDEATRAEQWALWQAAFERLDAGPRRQVQESLDRSRRARRQTVTFGVLGRRIEIPVHPHGTVGTAISRVLGAVARVRPRRAPIEETQPRWFADVVAAAAHSDRYATSLARDDA